MTPPVKRYLLGRLEDAAKVLGQLHEQNHDVCRNSVRIALSAVNDARTMVREAVPTVDTPDDRDSIPPGPVPPDPTLTPPLLRLLLDTVPPGWAFTFHRPDDKGY